MQKVTEQKWHDKGQTDATTSDFSEDGYLFILTVFPKHWKSDAEKP